MDRGWGINLGGGFHHCSAERGGGFCAYADITLAIKFLFQKNPKVKKAMIIDLDAHQVRNCEKNLIIFCILTTTESRAKIWVPV